MHSTEGWPQKDGLRIGHLNVNSFQNKFSEISSIIQNNGKPFHLFGCTESRLPGEKRFPDKYIKIPGYTPVRKNVSFNKSTGIIIYVNKSIKYKRLNH